MENLSKVQIIITIKTPDLDEQELEDATQKLYRQLLKLKDVEQVERVRDTSSLDGQKGGPYLPGRLKVEVERAKAEEVIAQLKERQKDAEIQPVNTKKDTIEASNRSAAESSANVREAAK